jgi:hypothetical protein
VRTAAVICLVALLLVGCGAAAKDSADDFKGDEKKVAAVFDSLEKAAKDDKPATVCTQLFAKTLLDALKKKGTNCVTAVKEAFKDADSKDLQVDDVKITGTAATAKITSGLAGSDQKKDTFSLTREGAVWKISSLGQ